MNRRAFGAAAIATLRAKPAAAEPAPFTAAERTVVAAALRLGDERFSLSDAALAARLLDHARTEAGQRVRPGRIDARWAIAPPAAPPGGGFACGCAKPGAPSWRR